MSVAEPLVPLPQYRAIELPAASAQLAQGDALQQQTCAASGPDYVAVGTTTGHVRETLAGRCS